MSDNVRRFRSVYNGLKKLYPTEPKGNLRRHLNTLAMLISGIVGSKSSNLPAIATKIADLRKPESRIKGFSRWINNDRIDYDTYYLPYVTALIGSLMNESLTLIFDGSSVGRNCITLMASVVYKSRALPICWITRTGKKGHFPEELHLELLQQIREIIPEQTQVIFLGDGEFDGMDLSQQITAYGWAYVCRTASNRIFEEDGQPFSLRTVGVGKERYFSLPKVYYSDHAYGSFHVMVWWAKGYEEPIYLITNLELTQEAFYWYKKRFHIETFFSDKKKSGI